MTINYGPYEPPPPTIPPPDGFGQPIQPKPPEERPPSAIGPLVGVLGLGGALIGLFALPTQSYGAASDVGYGDLHNLTSPDDMSLPAASHFAGFWWQSGLLGAVAVLTVLIGAMCVATGRQARRSVGAVTAAFALVVGALHAVAMMQTHDYASVVERLAPSGTLFHDAGLGPWAAFAGLSAVTLGAGFTAVLTGDRARR